MMIIVSQPNKKDQTKQSRAKRKENVNTTVLNKTVLLIITIET